LLDALVAGAVDSVVFAQGDHDNVELVAKVKRIQRLLSSAPRPACPGSAVQDACACKAPPLIAIGCSTGGPAALSVLLKALPKDLVASVVIVQHIDPVFAPEMAAWLNHHSSFHVRLAVERDRPEKGLALMASGPEHLVFRNRAVLGYSSAAGGLYRPSIDVFFQSVLEHWAGRKAAVLLTGMGKDGAVGLKRLRAAGALTIAQDRATSIVYGMPKAAAEIDAAKYILPLESIAAQLIRFVKQEKDYEAE
jgi:chemotaxis response regulator CheB